MSIGKLYITVTNSTYAYQLGNIHPISWLRVDITTHVREVYDVKIKVSFCQKLCTLVCKWITEQVVNYSSVNFHMFLLVRWGGLCNTDTQ